MKKIKDSKMQKQNQKAYIDEMGISARFCETVDELNSTFDDIRSRITHDAFLTQKQKTDLITASRFAQVIFQKRLKIINKN